MVVSHAAPTGDLAHNPDMCPRMGIEPVTLWIAGQHSIHGATPARTQGFYIVFKDTDYKTVRFAQYSHNKIYYLIRNIVSKSIFWEFVPPSHYALVIK